MKNAIRLALVAMLSVLFTSCGGGGYGGSGGTYSSGMTSTNGTLQMSMGDDPA